MGIQFVSITVESDVTGLKEVEKFEISTLDIVLLGAFTATSIATFSKFASSAKTGSSQLKEKDLDALNEDGVKQFASDIFTLSQIFWLKCQ